MRKWQWIQSSEKRWIELYTSSNTLAEIHQPLLMIGGMHGDEPEGVYLAESLLKWLTTVDKKSLHDFVIIPCINPDGFANHQRVNANGVDLNRNFPSRGWSPQHKENRYYPGPAAGSEIETQTVVNLINDTQPRLLLHFHSWKPCVVLTSTGPVTEAHTLAQSSGFQLVEDIGYPTPGSLGEYAGVDLNIPVICTEDTEHRDKNLAWQHFGEGLQKILRKS
ncbi:MAG: DUF2817 domain-containing protein [Bdellovibrionales bacterium]|nr:DUF2817 domain-containing protein [Bdellovibrionales bacterium]